MLPFCSDTLFPLAPTASLSHTSTNLVSIPVILSFQECCITKRNHLPLTSYAQRKSLETTLGFVWVNWFLYC